MDLPQEGIATKDLIYFFPENNKETAESVIRFLL